MKLFKKIRKGFTLIELVVVIAVIAILSAVSIVSYVSITNKAKQSNDQQKIDQVNLSAAAAEVSGKPETMYDALKAVEEDGFKPENFKAEAKNYEFAYALEENRFVILEKGNKVVYPKDLTGLAANSANVWRFASKNGDVKGGNSWYLLDECSGSFEVVAGLDIGENKDVTSVIYSSSAEQKVVFRTQGGTLSVTGSGTHVDHYGLLHVCDVKAVSGDTYVEHGTVVEMKVAASQKVELVKTAVVVELDSQSTEVTSSGYVGSVKAGSQQPKGSSEVGGSTIKVSTADQLQGLARASTLGTAEGFVNGKTIELENDIDLTGKEWVPFGYTYTNSYYGTIDGKNHKIIGLSNNSTDLTNLPDFAATSSGVSGKIFGLIGVACAKNNASLTIKNLTMEAVDIDSENFKGAGALVGVFGDIGDSGAAVNVSATFENVVVKGSLRGKDKIASFIGGASHNNYIEGHSILVKNCTNEANVEAILATGNTRAAGFVGQFGDANTDSKHETSSSLVFDGCTNKGDIKTAASSSKTYTGAFVAHYNLGNPSLKVTIEVKSNCVNTGTLTAGNTGSMAFIEEIA